MDTLLLLLSFFRYCIIVICITTSSKLSVLCRGTEPVMMSIKIQS